MGSGRRRMGDMPGWRVPGQRLVLGGGWRSALKVLSRHLPYMAGYVLCREAVADRSYSLRM